MQRLTFLAILSVVIAVIWLSPSTAQDAQEACRQQCEDVQRECLEACAHGDNPMECESACRDQAWQCRSSC